MLVLLTELYNKKDTNEYIKLLSEAYMRNGVEVIFGDENMIYSNVLPDFVHIQWPEAMYKWRNTIERNEFGIAKLKRSLAKYKDNNIKIVYTMHNIEPHDKSDEFDNKIYSLIIDYADIIVHHGMKSVEIIKRKYEAAKCKVNLIAPHGSYTYNGIDDSKICRRKYGIPSDKYIFTNIGKQKMYKGGKFIDKVFKNIDKNLFIFKMGPLPKNYNKNSVKGVIEYCIHKLAYLIKRYIYRSSKNKSIYKIIGDDELKDVMSATDIIFLGHFSGINSGIISLAITYGKPVIFPDIGNFKEQVKGWEWYETYKVGDIKSAKNAINKMKERLERYKPGSITFDNRTWKNINSWDIHVKVIIDKIN